MSLTRTVTRSHVYVTFANPYLACGQCQQRATGYHDDERCGCYSPWTLQPCGHAAELVDRCPSWGPVDGCTCTTSHTG